MNVQSVKQRVKCYISFLAIQMVVISPSGKPRHPVFREYFEQKKRENKPQALICISKKACKDNLRYDEDKDRDRLYEKS